MLNEANLISQFKKKFANYPKDIVGIGDDAAIIPIDEERVYVISKDLLIENVHFRLSYFDAASLAHKALHVNLSDLAAMGAKAQFILMGLALPPTIEQQWIDDFITHLSANCELQNIFLIGGDITASSQDLFISITALGAAKKDHLKFRREAKAGDIVCIAGTLGESHAGLIALERKMDGLSAIKQRTLHPQAKIKEGSWLSAWKEVHAMIDVSDGLYTDLKNICNASKLAAEINLENLLPSTPLEDACKKLQLDMTECMLTGGEDYALLFTADPSSIAALQASFQQQFGYPIIAIGKMTVDDSARNSVILKNHGVIQPFQYQPFTHFGE